MLVLPAHNAWFDQWFLLGFVGVFWGVLVGFGVRLGCIVVWMFLVMLCSGFVLLSIWVAFSNIVCVFAGGVILVGFLYRYVTVCLRCCQGVCFLYSGIWVYLYRGVFVLWGLGCFLYRGRISRRLF